jgi:TolA-binding protein
MSKMLFFPAILLALGVAGCATEPESMGDPENAIEAEPGAGKVDKETFKQRVEARLQQFEQRLANLRTKVKEARAEVREALQKDIDELHAKQEAVRARLAEMWQNGSEKWEEERLRLEADLDDIRDAIERAFSHVS